MSNANLGDAIYSDDYVSIFKNADTFTLVKKIGGRAVCITNILHGEDTFFVQFDGDVVIKHAPEGMIFAG